MAWIGPLKAVHHYLAVVHADKGDDGRFIISGEPVTVGLGGDEVVVPDGTVYFVRGESKNLAAGLGTTSQGVGGIKAYEYGPGYRAQPLPVHAAWPAKRELSGPRRNPIATAEEMVEKTKQWLVANDLASKDILFWSPDHWNEQHGDWKPKVHSGFVIVAEGTSFNYELAGYGGVQVYQSFDRFLRANGWWLQPITSWAFHIVPDDDKLRLRNPATTDQLEKYTPEELEAMPSLESGHWEELKVDEGNFRWWVSRMTRADGETHLIHVEERTPMGWRTVHKYGRLENPARHVHRENFKGYAQSAVRHMQLAKEAMRAQDRGRAWNMIRHAECDVRQAYTEASYASKGPEDAALKRMSGQLVKVHREIVAVMKELRREANPTTGQHVLQLATYIDQARHELLTAQAADGRGEQQEAAQAAGQAETHAILAVLQAEYLLPHAGETVEMRPGEEVTIPGKAQLERIRREAKTLGHDAQQLYMNSVCLTPQPWIAEASQGRTLH